MHAVTVFVDEAVCGDLPQVCVKSGKPADMGLVVRQNVTARLNPLWILLVFLGPIGWIAMVLLLALAPSGEELVIRVPYTEAAFARDRSLRRWRLWALLVAVGMCLLSLTELRALYPLGLGVSAWAFGAALVLRIAETRRSMRVDIDASRRWVTLSRVHPAFVEAVLASPSSSRRHTTLPSA